MKASYYSVSKWMLDLFDGVNDFQVLVVDVAGKNTCMCRTDDKILLEGGFVISIYILLDFV